MTIAGTGRLQGRRAIITGAAKGIGRATALGRAIYPLQRTCAGGDRYRHAEGAR